MIAWEKVYNELRRLLPVRWDRSAGAWTGVLDGVEALVLEPTPGQEIDVLRDGLPAMPLSLYLAARAGCSRGEIIKELLRTHPGPRPAVHPPAPTPRYPSAVVELSDLGDLR